jgi:hypothetical protein
MPQELVDFSVETTHYPIKENNIVHPNKDYVPLLDGGSTLPIHVHSWLMR